MCAVAPLGAAAAPNSAPKPANTSASTGIAAAGPSGGPPAGDIAWALGNASAGGGGGASARRRLQSALLVTPLPQPPQRRRQLLLQAAAGGGGGGGGGGGSSGVLGRMQRWAAGAWAFVARRPPPPPPELAAPLVNHGVRFQLLMLWVYCLLDSSIDNSRAAVQSHRAPCRSSPAIWTAPCGWHSMCACPATRPRASRAEQKRSACLRPLSAGVVQLTPPIGIHTTWMAGRAAPPNVRVAAHAGACGIAHSHRSTLKPTLTLPPEPPAPPRS